MTTINTAVFISRQGAARAIISKGREYGLSPAVVASQGRIIPKYTRGAVVGYVALCPRVDGSVSYILEN